MVALRGVFVCSIFFVCVIVHFCVFFLALVKYFGGSRILYVVHKFCVEMYSLRYFLCLSVYTFSSRFYFCHTKMLVNETSYLKKKCKSKRENKTTTLSI